MKFIILCSCLFLISCNFNRNNNWEENKLNGEVSSLKSTTFEASEKFGEIVKGDACYGENYFIKFDKNGFITENNLYSYNGNIVSKTVYKIDNNGNIIECMEYDGDGDLYSKVISNTDNCGNIIESIHYDNNGKQVLKVDYEYSNDKIIKEIHTTDSDSFFYVLTWDDNNLVEFKKISGSKVEFITKSKYDKRGNLIEGSHDYWNGLMKIEYKYDSNDNVIYEKETSNGKIEIFHYTYTYDTKNNWTKQIKFEGEAKKPIKITERVYEYYK